MFVYDVFKEVYMEEVKELKEDKLHLINKLFNNETIRTVWDKEKEKYYISVVDMVGYYQKVKIQENIGIG